MNLRKKKLIPSWNLNNLTIEHLRIQKKFLMTWDQSNLHNGNHLTPNEDGKVAKKGKVVPFPFSFQKQTSTFILNFLFYFMDHKKHKIYWFMFTNWFIWSNNDDDKQSNCFAACLDSQLLPVSLVSQVKKKLHWPNVIII